MKPGVFFKGKDKKTAVVNSGFLLLKTKKQKVTVTFL